MPKLKWNLTIHRGESYPNFMSGHWSACQQRWEYKSEKRWHRAVTKCCEILTGEIPLTQQQEIAQENTKQWSTLSKDLQWIWETWLKIYCDTDCARRTAFHKLYDQLRRLTPSLMSENSVIATQPVQQFTIIYDKQQIFDYFYGTWNIKAMFSQLLPA